MLFVAYKRNFSYKTPGFKLTSMISTIGSRIATLNTYM